MERTGATILFCVLSMLALCGCLGQDHYKSIPADLKIEAESNTCAMLSTGWLERVGIDSSGNGVYEYHVYQNQQDQGHVEAKTFRLSEEELLSLSNSIQKSGFFELKGEDSEVCIWDYCSTINVTINGTSKKFRNSGCDIKPFNEVENSIWSIARNKTGTQ